MLITHLGQTPRIDPSACVAPTANVCGNVAVGPDCRIMFGACVVAEGTSIEQGAQSSSWRMLSFAAPTVTQP